MNTNSFLPTRLRIAFVLAFAFVFFPPLLHAQEFYFRNFSGKDGLAQSQVYDLLEDSRGYIWMGTWGGGLSRYDGLEFSNHTEKQGLLSNYVYSLQEDNQQNIWIGTDKGLCRFDGNNYTAFLSQPKTHVYDLCLGSNGRLWIASHRGLYYFEDGEVSPFVTDLPALKKAAIRVCFLDSHGFLWLGGSNGLFVISPAGNIRHFQEEEEETVFPVFDIQEDSGGTIWVATDGGGIQWSDGQRRWSALGREEGLSSDRVLTLHRAATGEIWAGTTETGINIWNPVDSSISYLQERDGLESNDVRSIIEDSWGNHWVGTSGGGVSKYSGQQFILYDESDGLVDKEIYAIDEDSLGQLWLSTSKGISLYDGRDFQHYGRDSAWLSAKSRSVLLDREGRLWAGFDNRGLGIYEQDSFRLLTNADGVGEGLIRAIVQDSLGWIWVATTRSGITKVVPNPQDTLGSGYIIRQYNLQNDFPANYIYALLIDQEQRLWFATRYKGIGFFDAQGKVRTFDRRDGLPDNEVRTFAMDSLGHLWAGTARGGIFRFGLQADTLAIKSYGTNAQLTSNNIYQLSFDTDNQLWVGNERGVDRLQLDEAQDIAEVKAYGYVEGFKGGETCNNAVICDARGDMWFGTMNGLTHYLPGSGRKNTVAPKIHLKEVRLFYKPLEETDYQQWADPKGGLKKGLQLPHWQNSLGFIFQGINHSNPGKVSYQWQLEGYEEEWSPPSDNNSVNYSNLPSGNYTFKARAYNEDQVTNAYPVQATFSIQPPFWQRWWFRLTTIGSALLLIALLFRLRLNQVRRKAKEERERLEMEKNLLQLEQKALQLQMNPHFIFNALNSIQHLINQQDHQKARYQLAKFSKLMRATLENSRESLLLLSEEVQSLENYLALECFSRDRSFSYRIEMDENLDPEALWIPPMMIQPFVENAIIHGVAHLSERAGEIMLHFEKNGQYLQCDIIDNGIGREKARLLKSQQEEQHKSTALQVTRERLELLDNHEPHSPGLLINDLTTPNGDIIGTKVVLRMPLAFSPTK